MWLYRRRWLLGYLLPVAAAIGVYVALTWCFGARASNVPMLAAISLLLSVVCFRAATEVSPERPTSGAGNPVEPTGIVIDDQTPLEIGTRVVAYQRGQWWNAVVVGFQGECVIVRYVGWSNAWDEPQPRRNLQLLTPARPPETANRDRPAIAPGMTAFQVSQRDKLRDGDPPA